MAEDVGAAGGSSIDAGDGTGIWVNGREMTRAEVQQADADIEKVRREVALGRPEYQTPPDRQSLEEYRADTIRGRDRDPHGYWTQVMEFHGFTWLDAEAMNKIIGPMSLVPKTLEPLAGEKLYDALGRPIQNSTYYVQIKHEEGQWRNDVPGAIRRPEPWFRQHSLGFTMGDLVTLYGTPQAFDQYAKDMERRWRTRFGRVGRRGV